MPNANWASLALWRNATPGDALAVLNTTFSWWRSSLNDLWNVVALHGGLGYGLEGIPLANSHYGYYMVAWHTLFALSGQRYRAPSKSLTFWPKLPPPYELPVLIPRTVATLSARPISVAPDGDRPKCASVIAIEHELKVVAGRGVALVELSVNGSSPSSGLPSTLAVGDSVRWTTAAPSCIAY